VGIPNALTKVGFAFDVLMRGDPTLSDAHCWLVILRRKLADELAERGQNDEAMPWRSQALTAARGDSRRFYEIARERNRDANRYKLITCFFPSHVPVSVLIPRVSVQKSAGRVL
jgi:hypothetical protein